MMTVQKKYVITRVDANTGTRVNIFNKSRSYGNKGAAVNAMNHHAKKFPYEADLKIEPVEVVSKESALMAWNTVSKALRNEKIASVNNTMDHLKRFIEEQ